MGGIYSKDFLMYSSFLFPANIWSVFIGSQFSSVIPHAAASLPASSSTHKSRELLLLEISGKPSLALCEAERDEANTCRDRKKGI